jgi:hypothetical protein
MKNIEAARKDRAEILGRKMPSYLFVWASFFMHSRSPELRLVHGGLELVMLCLAVYVYGDRRLWFCVRRSRSLGLKLSIIP